PAPPGGGARLPPTCAHVTVDNHRTPCRPRHHHVRARALAHSRGLRPSREASEGGVHRPRLPAAPPPRDLLRTGRAFPATADPRGRHDPARRITRRHDGEPLLAPV